MSIGFFTKCVEQRQYSVCLYLYDLGELFRGSLSEVCPELKSAAVYIASSASPTPQSPPTGPPATSPAQLPGQIPLC